MNKIEALQRQKSEAQARVSEAERALEKAQHDVRRLESTLIHAQSDQRVQADQDTACGGCGADVSTELLFSLHYVIPDYRYANLGSCPTR